MLAFLTVVLIVVGARLVDRSFQVDVDRLHTTHRLIFRQDASLRTEIERS